MKVFITGGAGYIGSHMVAALGELGHDILVYDNLSTGHRDALLYGGLVVGDLGDKVLLKSTLQDFRPDAVMHFAAFIQVGESVREPLKYYRNNCVNAITLLESMIDLDINNFIFSSTAAVYGHPKSIPITDIDSLAPINPYGRSKAFVERILEDLSNANGLRYISLRYFNAAGADPITRIGERHDPETHLIPLAMKTAKGERKYIDIHGTDYPTPDGTCIRDYIHVTDLVDAHILALGYLVDGGSSVAFNCGYGHGYSVKQVIDVARKVTGVDLPIRESRRREGDSPSLIADSARLKQHLHWKPRYDDIEYIIKTAWNWENKLIKR
jgi:UDP-glucose 4-epimerase